MANDPEFDADPLAYVSKAIKSLKEHFAKRNEQSERMTLLVPSSVFEFTKQTFPELNVICDEGHLNRQQRRSKKSAR